MKNSSPKMVLMAVVSTVILAGCGGGGGSVADAVAPGVAQNVSAVASYINNLIAGTSENGDQVDVNLLTLAENDVDEPVAVP